MELCFQKDFQTNLHLEGEFKKNNISTTPKCHKEDITIKQFQRYIILNKEIVIAEW